MIIGADAFHSCKSLQSIDIPNSVTTIGNSAFAGCESLQSINVIENNPNYISIDGILFSKDEKFIIKIPKGKNLTKYKIPDSVTTIGENAFYGCESLQSIGVPDSVTEIGDWAFCGCKSLQIIHMHHKNIKDCVINGSAFTYVNLDKCTLYVPSGTRWAYRHHPVFGQFKNIEIENGISK